MSSLLARPRLSLFIAFLLSAFGAVAWLTMPRQEDPELPERLGLVLAPYPGADALTVERLVLDPIEDELASVDEVHEVLATARAGVAIVRIELGASIDTTDEVELAWDAVEEALADAARDFPAGVAAPELDRHVMEHESIVLAVTGSGDPFELDAAADRMERTLLGLSTVSRVTRIGAPDEQVLIDVDDATARRLGLDLRALAAVIGARTETTPGGSVVIDGRMASVRPRAELGSLEEVEATPVPLPGGGAVALGEVARVRRAPAEPAEERMRLDGRLAVGLGVVPRDRIDLVAFGAEVRAAMAELSPRLGPLRIHEVAFQPDHVKARLALLDESLMEAVVVVGLILFLFMGARLGLVAASIVPLVGLAAIGIYALGGGVLQQISIASIVISLGNFVDNVIVVAEDMQTRIDAGEERRAAALSAVRSLGVPLGIATATNIAAFVPMYLAEGVTGDFTRALPIVVSVTLTVSYVFALLVTPAFSVLLLRPRRASGDGWLARAAARVGELAVRRRVTVLAVAVALLAAAGAASTMVPEQFFPSADRNQVLIDLELPEGADVEATDAVAVEIERAVRERPEVAAVATFVGRGAPHFYYNVVQRPGSPQLAQLLVTTHTVEGGAEVVAWAQQNIADAHPEVRVVARRLEQGPPVAAPVEVRVYADDLLALEEGTAEVLAAMQAVPGATNVREDLGTGVPTVSVAVDDATAMRTGASRHDVALALLGRTRGLPVGELRSGDEPIPIILRGGGPRTEADDLAVVDVGPPGGLPVPLAQLARVSTEWRPAVIRHRDRRRVASVLAETEEGVPTGSVVGALQPRLAGLDLPPGVSFELGGADEGSHDANAALLTAVPIGVLLLVGFLLVEFNSFRRVLIILTTVPLSAVGIVPGLLAGGQPFGFMSLLGIIAIAGIVVNNAIILLDLADQRLAAGATPGDAMREAITRRVRPILLTAATTVVGLVPLALSPTSLWPPLAWSMISGLLASTGLTLFVVPALYTLLVGRRWRAPWWRRMAAGAAAAGSLMLIAVPAVPASAQDAAPGSSFAAALENGTPLAADEVARRAVDVSPDVARARASHLLARAGASAARVALYPRVEVTARYTRLSKAGGSVLGQGSAIDDARALLGEVEDPAARAILSGILDQSAALSELSFSSPADQWGLRAEVRYPVSDLFTQILSRVQASSRAARAARLRVEAVEGEVALSARLAWIEHARAVGARAVAAQAFERAAAQVELVGDRVREGSGSRAELLLAEGRMASAEAALARAEGGVEAARSALVVLADLPDRAYAPGASVLELPARPPIAREAAVARGIDRRPELRAVRAALDAQHLVAGAERRAGLPHLSVVAGADWADPNPRNIPVEDRFDGSWAVSVVISWSPSDSTTARRLAERADAGAAELEADLERLGDAVRIEVATALAAERASRSAALAAEAQQRAAEEAYSLRVLQVEQGVAVAADLLDADLEVSGARLAYLDAVLDVHAALARLRHATGD